MFLTRLTALISVTCSALPLHASAPTENLMLHWISTTNLPMEFGHYSEEATNCTGYHHLPIMCVGASHQRVWSKRPNHNLVTAQRGPPSRTPGGHSAPGGGPAHAPTLPSVGKDLMAPNLDSTLPDITPVPLPEPEAPAVAVPAPPASRQPTDEIQTPPNCEFRESRDANGCLMSRRYLCDGVIKRVERFSGCTN
jgi:hypothetical protein